MHASEANDMITWFEEWLDRLRGPRSRRPKPAASDASRDSFAFYDSSSNAPSVTDGPSDTFHLDQPSSFDNAFEGGESGGGGASADYGGGWDSGGGDSGGGDSGGGGDGGGGGGGD
jgi:hypothetical protein